MSCCARVQGSEQQEEEQKRRRWETAVRHLQTRDHPAPTTPATPLFEQGRHLETRTRRRRGVSSSRHPPQLVSRGIFYEQGKEAIEARLWVSRRRELEGIRSKVSPFLETAPRGASVRPSVIVPLTHLTHPPPPHPQLPFLRVLLQRISSHPPPFLPFRPFCSTIQRVPLGAQPSFAAPFSRGRQKRLKIPSPKKK